MVISIPKHFVWGHLEKTAGDITLAYFLEFKDDLQIGYYHGLSDRKKHTPFAKIALTDNFKLDLLFRHVKLLLNIRRLPSFILSYFYHFHINYNEKLIDFKRDVLEKTRKEISKIDYSTIGDNRLNFMLTPWRGRTLQISKWFRCENILDDFTDFVADYVSISKDAIKGKLTPVYYKPFNDYDHDLSKYWTLDDMKVIYNNNPAWTKIEKQVYGNLLTD